MDAQTAQIIANIRVKVAAKRRDARGETAIVDAAELLRRCRVTARAVMQGFCADDREEVAARLCATALADLGHDLPARENQRAVSFTHLRYRARDARRELLLKQEREQGDEASIAAAEQAEDITATIPTARGGNRAQLIEDAREDALQVCRTLRAPSVYDFAYMHLRDIDTAQAAAEVGAEPATFRKRCSRAQADLRRVYPDAIDLLRALESGAEYDLVPDCSRGAAKPTRGRVAWRAREWRSGTDGGSRPAKLEGTRAEQAEQARAACTLRKLRGGRRKARPMTWQASAEALTARARAEAQAAPNKRRARKAKKPTTTTEGKQA